jgi:hypothetical protein
VTTIFARISHSGCPPVATGALPQSEAIMSGVITVTDKDGGIIFSANIWVMLLIHAYLGKGPLGFEHLHVYIDEEEIPKPAHFDDP